MKHLLAIFVFFFLITSAGFAQDKSGLLVSSERVQFSGVYAGVNAIHNATDPLWLGYSRNLTLTTGATWNYFTFTAVTGVPIYKTGGAAKETYLEFKVELKLL